VDKPLKNVEPVVTAQANFNDVGEPKHPLDVHLHAAAVKVPQQVGNQPDANHHVAVLVDLDFHTHGKVPGETLALSIFTDMLTL
jgi:hypothetical protein